MSAFYILLTTAVYFLLLFAISRKMGGKGDNDAFFRGNRQSPWWAVAFGMVGASVSGISFVSVPGMVRDLDMTYMQMCVGFFFGYLVVAFVLLPLYYKLNLTSIYTYLDLRFGKRAYRTGASFFLLSKILSSAARLYLVCLILQEYVFGSIGIPFALTAAGTVFLIWLYTFRGGIKALVWTDSLQTFCLIAALLLIIYQLCHLNGFTVSEAVRHIAESPHSRWLEWDDWTSRQHFVKQFLSGVFIVIVMTGLDQDMMQKNLTCKSLRDAQKDMCSYGVLFISLNWLFLSLGILLLTLAAKEGIALPVKGDDILPLFCAEGYLGHGVLILFTIGIIAAAFSSVDSALTALTTSFCVDILDVERRYDRPERVRKWVHGGIALLFVGFILCFEAVNNSSIINAIYVVASYTYGPLLGLFSFGLFTRRMPRPVAVPLVCVAAPVCCYLLDAYTTAAYGYHFGYELLMLNGFLTFVGLYAVSSREGHRTL
ncbi:MAG: sodium:solute symporter [Paraprevotella sp.]|nr:sodium:solute symporter [Paraprevotella sp.]